MASNPHDAALQTNAHACAWASLQRSFPFILFISPPRLTSHGVIFFFFSSLRLFTPLRLLSAQRPPSPEERRSSQGIPYAKYGQSMLVLNDRLLSAQVHQRFCRSLHKSINFASACSGIFFCLALAQALQVVCGASYCTTGWARCRRCFLLGFTSAALLWFLSFNFCLCARAAVCLWWLRLTVRGFFTY